MTDQIVQRTYTFTRAEHIPGVPGEFDASTRVSVEENLTTGHVTIIHITPEPSQYSTYEQEGEVF